MTFWGVLQQILYNSEYFIVKILWIIGLNYPLRVLFTSEIVPKRLIKREFCRISRGSPVLFQKALFLQGIIPESRKAIFGGLWLKLERHIRGDPGGVSTSGLFLHVRVGE